MNQKFQNNQNIRLEFVNKFLLYQGLVKFLVDNKDKSPLNL